MEEYELWLHKAEDDLAWTQDNVKAGVYYGACFTAHESAEKALKAFLLYKKRRLRRIHDLNALLEDCSEIDKGFEKLREAVEFLLPFYIETRYPIYEELVEFDEKQAAEALEKAKEVVEFVKERISAP